MAIAWEEYSFSILPVVTRQDPEKQCVAFKTTGLNPCVLYSLDFLTDSDGTFKLPYRYLFGLQSVGRLRTFSYGIRHDFTQPDHDQVTSLWRNKPVEFEYSEPGKLVKIQLIADFTGLWVKAHCITMKTCRILYEKARRTGVRNLSIDWALTDLLFETIIAKHY